jgi:autotransporter-associated beta strand protein
MKPASSNRFLASLALAFASFNVAVSANTVTTSWDYYTASGSGDTSWVAPASTSSVLAIDWGTGGSGTATNWGGIDWAGSNAGASFNASGTVKTWYSEPGIAWGNSYGDNTFYPSSSFPLLGSGVTGSDNHILEIRDLNPGQEYKIQFVLADSRTLGAPDDDRSITISGAAGTTGAANNYRYGYSDGQYAVVTANVVADAGGYAVFKPSGFNDNGSIGQQINAMQVLAVNNPSLSWISSDGTWSSSDTNWTGNVAWTDSTADAVLDNASSATAIAIDGTQTAATVLIGNGGNNGLYTLSGGALNADALIVQGNGSNDPGTGSTAINNVDLNTVGDLGVGRWDLNIGGTSTVTIGGQLRSTSNGNGMGDWGRVTIHGSANVTATGGVSSSGSAWGLTLDGATLTTPSIRAAENAHGAGSRLTLKGGTTMIPTQDTGSFISVDSTNQAYVGAGGANFDTNGKNITVGVNLVNDGGGSITKLGAGTLTLTGSSNYSGGTFVDEGKLVLPGNGGNGRISGALTVDPDGTVETNGDGTGFGYNDQLTALTINGGLVRTDGQDCHIWNITGGVSMTGGELQTNGAVSSGTGRAMQWNRTALTTNASDNSAVVSGRVNLRGDWGYTNWAVTVAEGTAATDLLVSAAITGGGVNITKSGAGTMALTGSNTYTGNTTVEEGVLSLGNGTLNTNLADSAQVAIASGAKIDLNFTGTDVIGSLMLNGSDAGTGVFNASTHPAYFTGTGKLFILGSIADGTGTWSATSNDFWEFPSAWQSGTVASGVDQTATFDGATGTTASLVGNITIGNLSFSGANYTIAGASKTLALNSTTNSTIFVDTGRTATISSKLTSTGEVFKTGNGTLKLYAGEGDNYSGVYNHDLSGLDIQGGTVELNSQYIRLGNINIGSGATLSATVPWATGSSNPWFDGRSAGPITVQSGGTLNTTTIANSIMQGLTLLGGSVTAPGVTSGDWGAFILASTLVADGNATSTIAAEMAVTGTRTMDVLDGSTLVVSGDLHNRYGTSAGGITKDGDGTLVFTGAKTYTGPTTVNLGTLQLGDGTTNGSTPGSVITNYASLVFNPATSQSFSQTVSGTGSLTKTGTGTFAITGPQSYTGDTIVSGGTLELQNNIASAVYATVLNPGFEIPDYTGSGWSYLGNDGIVAWSFSGGGIGSNGSPWLSTAPEGDQAGFIQINGTISQTIIVASPGDYVVTFKSANRPGYGATNLAVSIDATNVGSWTAAELSTGGGFVTRSTSPITLTAGTHTLTFTSTTPSGDTGTAIDDVKVTLGALTNGSLTFQPDANTVCNKVTGSGSAVMNGQFYLDLSSADVANGNSWTLVNHATLNESYGSDFSVTSNLGDFTESPAGTWKRTDGNNTWTFTTGTGELTLAVAPADPFANWMSTNYPAIVSPNNQPGADPDNDCIINLLEFVLNGIPNASDPAILPVSAVTATDFEFTFIRRKDSASTSQVFQYCDDLTSWTDNQITIPPTDPGSGPVTITPVDAVTEQVKVTISRGSYIKLFGRLLVEK